MDLPVRQTTDVGLLAGSSQQAKLVLIILAAIGMLFSSVGRLLIPPPGMLAKALEPKQPPWFSLVQEFWDFLGSVEGSLIAFGIFACVAAYSRYRPRALFGAFIAGVYLATALFR